MNALLAVPARGRWVAGIGSRETPAPYLRVIRTFAADISGRGYGLRSGGARGADQAWEEGAATGPSPVQSFRVSVRPGEPGIPLNAIAPAVVAQAAELASRHHRGWARLQDYARALMTRNCLQVLGPDLQDPVAHVLCWAADSVLEHGRVVDVAGGTGLAVRLAHSRGIPVLNLALPDHLDAARRWHRTPELAIESLGN